MRRISSGRDGASAVIKIAGSEGKIAGDIPENHEVHRGAYKGNYQNGKRKFECFFHDLEDDQEAEDTGSKYCYWR
jgi:hypothetical protein